MAIARMVEQQKHGKAKVSELRTLHFWIRVIPRKGKTSSQVYHRIYKTKKAATAARKPGEEVVPAIAHIWSQR